MSRFERLFSPIQVGAVELKNRIIMPAMEAALTEEDGSMSERAIRFYEARARGGAAMIIPSSTAVSPEGRVTPFAPGIWNDDVIPGWADLAKAIHRHGSTLVLQISHGGRQAAPGFEAVAPSAIPSPPLFRMSYATVSPKASVPRELSIEEIEDLIEKYAEAARRARDAGADGVEIHGAHGYLIAQFLSPYSNKRIDAYGGTIEGRLKFAVEVIKRTRAKVGRDFLIQLRMSAEEPTPGGLQIRETKVMVPILVEAGLDAISVSAGTYNLDGYHVLCPLPMDPLGTHYDRAAALKEVSSVPVAAVGRIKDPLVAEQILREDKVDLIAMGRALIADPDLPNKAAAGDLDEIRPCLSCGLGCGVYFMSGIGMTCTLNPAVAKEEEMVITPAERPKNVLVVGGGPGGLEAATVAAQRGHRVTLMEKSDKLGGQWRIAAVPPLKQDITAGIRYLVVQAEKAGVSMEMNKEVTPETVDALEPDVVVVATGAAPLVPDIPGVENEIVATAIDVLSGEVPAGNRAVIIGGGQLGLEMADYMREREAEQLVVVEQLPEAGVGLLASFARDLLSRLDGFGARIVTSAKVKEIIEDGVVLDKDGEEETIHGMDSVVLAMGMESVDKLSERLESRAAEVYVIGDAKEPRNALEAVAEGARVGMRI
ncbi:MAG: FAD-dependent oxidoreductase [Deltaproteobacteria bacterium]|nr:FAD-dependent oxidoreductase [Deltaproteobacteria bacterium]